MNHTKTTHLGPSLPPGLISNSEEDDPEDPGDPEDPDEGDSQSGMPNMCIFRKLICLCGILFLAFYICKTSQVIYI